MQLGFVVTIAKSPWFYRLLTIVTLGGGFLGAIETLNVALNSRRPSAFAAITFAIASIVYIYGIFIGLRIGERRTADGYTLFYFTLQVPYVSSPLLVYRFTCGLQSLVAIIDSRFAWSFRLGSDWQLAIFSPYPVGFGVNIFPLLVLLVLYVVIHRRQEPRKSNKAIQPVDMPAWPDY